MSVPARMKAAMVTGYGGPDCVAIQTCQVPAIGPAMVLIKVVAASVSSGDARIRGLNAPKGMKTLMRAMMGWTKPRQPVLGTEVSGYVVQTGADVSEFAVGDAILAFPGTAMGGHAEYVAVSTKRPIVKKPDVLSLEEAAGLCFGGTTALHFLRRAKLKPGETVLIIGASGSVGTALVQLAKAKGAHVTTATSSANTGLMQDLGADETIDYSATDYTRASARYDVIADCVDASSFSDCFDALKPGGRYLAIAGDLGALFARGRDGKSIIAGMASERSEDVAELARMAAEGRYRVVIDTEFALDDIAAAHARVDGRHKRGNVIVRMDEWTV